MEEYEQSEYVRQLEEYLVRAEHDLVSKPLAVEKPNIDAAKENYLKNTQADNGDGTCSTDVGHTVYDGRSMAFAGKTDQQTNNAVEG